MILSLFPLSPHPTSYFRILLKYIHYMAKTLSDLSCNQCRPCLSAISLFSRIFHLSGDLKKGNRKRRVSLESDTFTLSLIKTIQARQLIRLSSIMKPTVIALLQLVFAHSASALLSTNVTRIQNKDKFTNPNRTAVKACLASGKSSSFPDSCVKFDSVNTQAECWTSRDCCESCRCKVGYPTYLAHLGKCVSLSELNSDVFGHGSTGRSLILLFTIILLNSRMLQVCLRSAFSVSNSSKSKFKQQNFKFHFPIKSAEK